MRENNEGQYFLIHGVPCSDYSDDKYSKRILGSSSSHVASILVRLLFTAATIIFLLAHAPLRLEIGIRNTLLH